jgi:hypothetical protein
MVVPRLTSSLAAFTLSLCWLEAITLQSDHMLSKCAHTIGIASQMTCLHMTRLPPTHSTHDT